MRSKNKLSLIMAISAILCLISFAASAQMDQADKEEEEERARVGFKPTFGKAARKLQKSDEWLRYEKVQRGKTSTDLGFHYTRKGDGSMDVEVSAITTGKGVNYRKWKVAGMKLDIDGTLVRPAGESQNFYVAKASIFRYPAAVVFAAIGTQYEMYGSACSGSGSSCAVTGQPGHPSRGAVAGAIDKAGMAAGLGLLVTQAKGEITGQKSVFKLNKDLVKKLDKSGGTVKLIIENAEKQKRKRINIDFSVPNSGKRDK